jgi:nucleoside-diphosphate-sugar epimerase
MAPETEEIRTPVNFGNPQELTVMDIAQKMLALTGPSSAIVYEPLPADDPRVRRPDITRAQTLLGWRSMISLEEGLRRTIDHFKTLVPCA